MITICRRVSLRGLHNLCTALVGKPLDSLTDAEMSLYNFLSRETILTGQVIIGLPDVMGESPMLNEIAGVIIYGSFWEQDGLQGWEVE